MVPLPSGSAYLSNLKSSPLESLIHRFLGIVQVALFINFREKRSRSNRLLLFAIVLTQTSSV